MMMKVTTALAILALAGCQTTSPDLDTLPDYLGDIVIDEEPRPAPVVTEPEVDAPIEPATATPFETDGPGPMPYGCKELRERDPEANCR